MKDEEDSGKAQENTEDEVLIWGVPGRLDTELKHLAHSCFFRSLPLSGPLSHFSPFSNGPSESVVKSQSKNVPSLYATLACNSDFP